MNNSKLTYALLVLILVAGLLLARPLYASPFYMFDDSSYIGFAHQMLSGSFNPAESPYSYGFLLPLSLALSFSIFGINVFASILPAIVEYLAIILLTFAISRKLYDNKVGLVSAFLIAIAPFVVGYSTRVLPDMGVGVFAGLSLLFFVYAQESKKAKQLYFLSGACAALTVYIKMIGLAYILFFIIILLFQVLRQKKPKKDGASFLYSFAGVLVILIAYACIMFLYSGSLFGSFLAYGQNQSTISPSSLGNNLNAMLTVLFNYSSPYGMFLDPVADPQVFPLGLIIFFAIVGTAIALYQRERSLIYLSILLWGVFFYLFLGSVTLTKYSFIFVVSRYFIMVSVPMAILGGYAIWAVYNACRPILRSYAVCALLLMLIVVIVSNIPLYRTLYNYNISISGDTRTFSNALKYVMGNPANPGVPNIFANENSTANFLMFLSSYSKSINIATLNTSNKNVITRQLGQICGASAGGTYFALSYDNYTTMRYNSIFSNWISPNCNLTKLKSFYDNASSGSIYNGTNVRVDLYKVN